MIMMVENKMWVVLIACIALHAGSSSGAVKTTSGQLCVFPFTYQGVVYNECTTKNHNRPWCSTTAKYVGKWGNCEAPKSSVKTTKGEYCVFPFTYQGVVYNKCTTKNHNRPWCSTTAKYVGKWGNCEEPVIPTTPASKWELLGCYTDSSDRAMPHYFKTVESSDYKHIFDECSKEAEELGYTYFGVQYFKECWGSKDAHATYDKHGCTNNCKVKGDYGIGAKWSNFVYHLKSAEWTECSAKECGAGVQHKLVLSKDTRPNCPLYNVKLTTSETTQPCSAPKTCPVPTSVPVKTTSGQLCVFPFTYQGVVYNKCTTKNHNRPWCSTTAKYVGKWGNCEA